MDFKEQPGPGRMERKKEEIKRRIVAIAMPLFVKQGVEGTTMEQIAREVDIAKGTLYNYFPVKEAIIDEHIKRMFRDRQARRVEELHRLPDTRARLIQVISEGITGIREHQEIFERYLVYRMQSMVSVHLNEDEKSGFQLATREIIALGQASGEIRDDLPGYVLLELFDFAFIEVVKRIFVEQDQFQADETIALYVDLCINGVKRK